MKGSLMKGSLLLLLAATHAFHSAPSHRIPRAARARHHHHHRAATPKMLGLPEKPFEAGVAALIGLGILIKVAPFVVVPPGEVGVVTTLGKMNPDPLGPGLALRNPISRVQLFSTKTQLSEEENFVPTKEGLTVELDTALLYRIDSASAPQLSIGRRALRRRHHQAGSALDRPWADEQIRSEGVVHERARRAAARVEGGTSGRAQNSRHHRG